MPRYALRIEYDGRLFSGWQRQNHAPSVQQAIETALSYLEPDTASITAAGRTDAGVHAFGQVAHCDLARGWDPFRLAEALNHHLKPHAVAICAAAQVAPDFHARFDAVERSYVYRIICRRAPLTFDKGKAWRVPSLLDAQAMHQAGQHLVGRHDFTTFRASQCQAKSPVKTLTALSVTAQDDQIRIDVRARSFLHNQVRSFVGSLERVGAGAWAIDQIAEVLAAKDRSACGPVAPPTGLYLAAVRYPTDPFDG
ncbi:MAG: tRNA pseudouridine(38-40) synthase TruA [Pseudomonadota bacterium]